MEDVSQYWEVTMEATERKVPTLIDRRTEGTKHALRMDVTGCEEPAQTYLQELGVEYAIDKDRHTASFTLDTEGEAHKVALDRLIADAGVGRVIAGYGIVRALAFPLEFHEEVEEAEYGGVAAASTVTIGGKKKRDVGLWAWEYLVPVLLAILVGVGYAGLATHQRNADAYIPVALEDLRGNWYEEYVGVSGLRGWLHPVTNKFTITFPAYSVISKTKKHALVAIGPDTILVVGETDNADGIWYPEEKQFVGSGENLILFLHPDSVDAKTYEENSIDATTIEYNKVDRVRKLFEEGSEKKHVQLGGAIVIEESDFYMPVKSGKIKIIPQSEMQKLYLGAAQEATIMGQMRFYRWINEDNPSRSRKETKIVGEFDLALAKIWGRYM